MTSNFCRIRFTSASENNLLSLVTNLEGPHAIHFAAASTVVEAHQDDSLRRILNDGLTIADGFPLRKALQVFSPEFAGCRGTDFMKLFLTQSSPTLGHYFLGAERDTLDRLLLSIKEMNDTLHVTGSHSPVFSDRWEEIFNSSLEAVMAASPQIIWVGLGSPKQDFIAHALAKHTKAQVFAVGAAFDFLAGVKREAPSFMQKSGTEWLFRLIAEPRRLWRRYLLGNIRFTILIINHFRQNFVAFLRAN